MSRPSATNEVIQTLGGYLRGQFKVAVILALLYTIGYAIVGVPWWAVLGPISGALNLIPVLGGVAALLLGALVTLIADGTMYNTIGLLVVFIVVQAFEGFYLTPKLVGSRVGLRPWAVFLAILIGGITFGPLGVLVAVPMLAVVAVLWRRRKA